MIFTQVGGRPVPIIGQSGDPYKAKGQHPQCQPRVGPGELKEKRDQFFTCWRDGLKREE